ncbi:MAG: phosphoribosyltransferase [Chloroflexi bacterium]|nr:phosphoribosyltransferase [Chloroflexota bacterium]
MTDTVSAITPEKDFIGWDELESLVEQLAARIGQGFDVMLVITRGGMVPAGMLAYQLGIRTILVAPVVAYDDVGAMHDQPVVLGFPGSDQLAGHDVLVVDEVWETGNTITAVVERVRAAGGRPVTAVLHYKPTRSRTDLTPDHFVHETDRWVVYPYKYGK